MDEHKENIHGQEDNVKTSSVKEQEKVGELAESLLLVNVVCVEVNWLAGAFIDTKDRPVRDMSRWVLW